MNFWNIFKKKDKDNGAADASVIFVPTIVGGSIPESSPVDTPSPTPSGGEVATTTDSGASFSGGDVGGASGGDGGASGI